MGKKWMNGVVIKSWTSNEATGMGGNYLKDVHGRWVTIDVSPPAPLHDREKVTKTMKGSNETRKRHGWTG